jgi:hypothetical protein
MPLRVCAAGRFGRAPLRLQLGAESVAAVRGHAERLLEDLASWERVALDTRVDGATA